MQPSMSSRERRCTSRQRSGCASGRAFKT
jgi:hypothetical protein